MEGQPRVTPRAKDVQVAPEGAPEPDAVTANINEAASARIAPETPNTSDATTACNEVEHQVRTAGRRGLKENILIYLKLSIPTLVMTLWMFGIYTALSWTVPHVLCRHEIEQLSVRASSPCGSHTPNPPLI